MSNIKPMILFVTGVAGAGKTMTGKIIASKLQATYIDKDTLYKPLLSEAMQLTTGNPHDRNSEFYCTHFKPREYEGMIDTALENAKLNPAVVVVGPLIKSSPGAFHFEDPEMVKELNRRCRKIGASWHVVWIYSSNETVKKMIQTRGAPRDDWKLVNWDAYVKQYHVNIEDPKLPVPYTVLTNNGRHLKEIEKDVDAFLLELGLDRAPLN